MNRTKYLLKNMGILTISNFASKILIFLLVPLYTTVLSTVEYGTYDLAVSTVTLLYPILSLNIVDAVMRFSMDKEYSKEKIAVIGFKLILISIAIFAVGMILFNKFKIWPEINGLEGFVFLYYFSYVFNQFLIQFAKGLECVREMGTAGVISTFAMVGGNIFFLLVLKEGLPGFFLANIIAQGISAIYLLIKLKLWVYLKNLNVEKTLIWEMLVYCLPLLASTIGWWVNSASDKYVVAFMLGVSANGILSVSYKIPQIINVVQSIFIQAWQISAIKEYGEKDTARFYGKTFLIINVFMCAACSWLILLTRPLAYLMYAKDFFQAWQYVPFLLISSVFNCASGLLGPILSAQKNSKAMMWSAIIGASVNIIMNITLVHYIGIQGATIATLICSIIIYEVRKIAVGKDIIIERYKVVIVTWLLLCVQAFVEIYLKACVIEITLMIVMLIINKKNLYTILCNTKELVTK